MSKFCRNCGKELIVAPETTCPTCGAAAVKATAFCRFCGHATTADDTVCPTCSAVIRPGAGHVKARHQQNKRLTRPVKILYLSLAAIIVITYAAFTLPLKVTKAVKFATADAIQAATGYTATPLQAIAAVPNQIPPLNFREGAPAADVIAVNRTQQLAIYAVYKSTTGDNTTTASRLVDVTDKCVYKSNNEKIATVNASGSVRTVGPGSAIITVSYTTAPGSANLVTAFAEGKVPVTYTVDVPVIVR